MEFTNHYVHAMWFMPAVLHGAVLRWPKLLATRALGLDLHNKIGPCKINILFKSTTVWWKSATADILLLALSAGIQTFHLHSSCIEVRHTSDYINSVWLFLISTAAGVTAKISAI